MFKLNKKVVAIGLVSVMAMSFLVGCGNAASGNGGSNGSGSSATVQGVTDDTITVANSVATSGAFAPVGVPYVAGMEAYFAMINEAGGVNGRTINYIHQDDEFSPERGVAILEGFIHDDQVFAIVGHFGTPVVAATLDTLKEEGIPAVYFATGAGILYNEDAIPGNGNNIFPVQPVYPMEGRIMAAWAAGEFGASKLGVIYTNDDAGTDLLNGITQEAANIEGLEVVDIQVNPGAEDVSAAVITLMEEQVDVVIIASIQGTFPQIARELANQGNTAPAITTYTNVDGSMVAAVAEAVGTQFDIYGSAWVDVNSPEVATFAEWIQRTSSEDFSANSFAMAGWIAASFFVQGLERVEGDLTWESYIEALESEPVKNPFGGYTDFSDGQRVGTQELSLFLMDPSNPAGWVPAIDFMTIEDILGSN